MTLPLITRPPMGCGDPGDAIEYGCLFDGGYLSRDLAADGVRTTGTISFWIKAVGDGVVFGQDRQLANDGNFAHFYLSGDRYRLKHDDDDVHALDLQTDFGLRDYSAWTHFVITWDTTEQAPANRARIYKDGVRITNFVDEIYPEPGKRLDLFTADVPFFVGDRSDGGKGVRLSAYLAEFVALDGIAADPTAFGYVTAYGHWVPRQYTGPYGANGFHLDFSDPLDLGKDVSGNGNHFAGSGMSPANQVQDTPTSNGLSFNPLHFYKDDADGEIEDANKYLYATSQISGPGYGFYSNIPLQADDDHIYYGEFTFTYNTNDGSVDFVDPATGDKPARFFLDFENGSTRTQMKLYAGGVWTSIEGNVSESTKNFRWALQPSSGKVWLGKDGTWHGGVTDADVAAGLNPTGQADLGYSGLLLAGYSERGSGAFTDDRNYLRIRTSPPEFLSSQPSGTVHVSTATMPCPAILNPDDYFTLRLSSGGADVTDLPWDPTQHKTLVLTKRRDTTSDWRAVDTLRGAGLAWASNTTGAEISEADGITGFYASGYTVGAASAYQGDRVDYIWRASRKAGFDIVTVDHITGAPTTVTHAVGGLIDYAWVVPLGGGDRRVYHRALTSDAYLTLNSGASAQTDSGWFASTATNLTLGASMPTGTYYVYAWRAVPGFSAFSEYTGNGLDDGPYVATGFVPRLVVRRRTSNTGNHNVQDTTRSPINPVTAPLTFNSSGAEGGNYQAIDCVSGGIKSRSSDGNANSAGYDFVSCAWAETPGKFARAQ